MGRADREGATARVAALGIADRVQLAPWLVDDEFVAWFAGASLIVFPSDFEGFGLPAIEAMRLRIPLVVSTDVALAEVTGGHAAVAQQLDPATLAAAMADALAFTPAQLDEAYAWTEQFTWRAMADAIRANLASPRK
jgi:glycosyltransferase involved in cell wall biosynthesis